LAGPHITTHPRGPPALSPHAPTPVVVFGPSSRELRGEFERNAWFRIVRDSSSRTQLKHATDSSRPASYTAEPVPSRARELLPSTARFISTNNVFECPRAPESPPNCVSAFRADSAEARFSHKPYQKHVAEKSSRIIRQARVWANSFLRVTLENTSSRGSGLLTPGAFHRAD